MTPFGEIKNRAINLGVVQMRASSTRYHIILDRDDPAVMWYVWNTDKTQQTLHDNSQTSVYQVARVKQYAAKGSDNLHQRALTLINAHRATPQYDINGVF